MEVHPAGLSADGMRQAHDQGSGREVGWSVCVIVGRRVVPCLLLTAGFLCFVSQTALHIIMWTYRRLELLNWPVSQKQRVYAYFYCFCIANWIQKWIQSLRMCAKNALQAFYLVAIPCIHLQWLIYLWWGEINLEPRMETKTRFTTYPVQG